MKKCKNELCFLHKKGRSYEQHNSETRIKTKHNDSTNRNDVIKEQGQGQGLPTAQELILGTYRKEIILLSIICHIRN